MDALTSLGLFAVSGMLLSWPATPRHLFAQRIPPLPDRRLYDSQPPRIFTVDETTDLSSSLVPVSEIAAFLLPGRFSLGRCFGDDHLAPLIPSSGAFFILP